MTDVERLLQVADPFGEAAVIRDVARRAGLLWTCRSCTADNFGAGMVCVHCMVPDTPERPTEEWTCVCGATTFAPWCPVCHRLKA